MLQVQKVNFLPDAPASWKISLWYRHHHGGYLALCQQVQTEFGICVPSLVFSVSQVSSWNLSSWRKWYERKTRGDCPSPTLTAQPKSGPLMHSTYRTGFYGRSATLACRRHCWGYLVVPTRWRRWGWSMDYLSFCHISLKGLKEDSASSCSQGAIWSSSPRDPRWGNPKRAAGSNYHPLWKIVRRCLWLLSTIGKRK